MEEELKEEVSIEQLIEERQAKKAQIDAIDEERKALDKKIEELSGPGTNHFGKWSVSSLDTTEERFDSSKFKKENPELAKQYTEEKPKHIFKIVELKEKSAS